MQKKNKNAGQSVLEYLVLVAIVIVVLFIFMGRGGVFESTYNGVMSRQGNDLVNMALRIFN